MKKLILIILLFCYMAMPVQAADLTAPTAPDQAQDLMPPDTESFGEGLLYVFKSAVEKLEPEIAAGCGVCLAVIAVVILTSLVGSFPGTTKNVTELAGTIAVACLLLGSANTLVKDAAATVTELSEYGKMLLPVMTTAMAAQGGISGSAAIYTGTAVFDAVLCGVISRLLVPMTYIFLAMGIASAAIGEDILKKLRDFMKWLISWSLKIVLYVFTGYITVTGVVSGTADQAALKATKLTISGAVPVVGSILSDASEAILVGAGVVKSAVGVYGLLAIAAIAIGPFLRIGVQYLLLKLTAAICGVFGSKKTTELISDFSGAMGLLLAMTGTVCLMLLISMVCFMKGVSG
ncbi:MAG: stage III sporulation protein AE [Oscillospiraceae bacterium]|nr:stage III sporulation protein AE [Oscillospiraceae bacterium]